MYLKAKTLDDLLRRTLAALLRSSNRINPTKGEAREIIGVILELERPHARLSATETKGTLFSCLGELLWYLAGSNDLAFIKYYIPGYDKFSDDGKTIWGAYGPRLFNMRGIDQFRQVRDRLKVKRDTRKAVIQLFDAGDITTEHEDVPCTCTLQFMIRGDHLFMFTNMRSNDAFLGLPHDFFAFTMLQEILARDLSVGLGPYKHSVGSLHLYDTHIEDAKAYLSEGWQSTILMPPIPKGDPWPSIKKVLDVEAAIRGGRDVDIEALSLDEYWADFARLLKIFSLTKGVGNREFAQLREVVRLKNEIKSPQYDQYVRRRTNALIRVSQHQQLDWLG
jgi:thymidylate synthase